MMRKFAAAYIVYQNRKKRTVKRRPSNLRRNWLGEYQKLWQEIQYDSHEFFVYTRMTKPVYDVLLHKLRAADVVKESNKYVIPFESRVAMTLRFLSQGADLKSLAVAFQCGKSTVQSIVNAMTKSIWEILSLEYVTPPTTEEWSKIESKFRHTWNMPNCVGAIDGKHVEIEAPPNSGSRNFNNKKNYSIVLMAACDADYKFTLVNVGDLGSSSDGGTFASSDFGRAILDETSNLPSPKKLSDGSSTTTNHYFVADEAFPLKVQVMRPFPGRGLSYEKLIFNYRLSRSRRTIEKAFEILAAQWRLLNKPIHALPENVDYYVLACIALHNFLMVEMPHEYCPVSFADSLDKHGSVTEDKWRAKDQPSMAGVFSCGNRPAREAVAMREKLCHHFLYEGAVPWQDDTVRSTGPRRVD